MFIYSTQYNIRRCSNTGINDLQFYKNKHTDFLTHWRMYTHKLIPKLLLCRFPPFLSPPEPVLSVLASADVPLKVQYLRMLLTGEAVSQLTQLCVQLAVQTGSSGIVGHKFRCLDGLELTG